MIINELNENRSKSNKNHFICDSKYWKNFPVDQMPLYENEEFLIECIEELKKKSSLVSIESINNLNALLQSNNHNQFIFQLGYCAELFEDLTHEYVNLFINFFEDIQNQIDVKCLFIPRMLGQFAKPRSNLYEYTDQGKIPSFHGCIINGQNLNERTPNPSRMIDVYNAVKPLITYVQNHISKNMIYDKNLYFSHEGYLLPFEESMIRYQNGLMYNTSSHVQWIGDRTRSINHAHVEFFKHIQNPVFVKIGPSADPSDLIDLYNELNPKNISYKIGFIFRFGAQCIESKLSTYLDVLKNKKCLILIDPMHGNTKTLSNGFKTRFFNDVYTETELFFKICKSKNIRPHGINLECSFENISECMDENINEEMVKNNYKSACDPRLNRDQTLKIINLISKNLSI